MIKLHEYKCESKYELNLEERRVIDEYKAKLNCNIPSRTTKEWREDNKEKIKEWREDNKEELKEYSKKYYENNKEHINGYFKKWREDNKEHINGYSKKWYENNKEKSNEYSKKYYENNKEKNSEKITCECGAIFRKDNISHHHKTKKHISFLDNMKAN